MKRCCLCEQVIATELLICRDCFDVVMDTIQRILICELTDWPAITPPPPAGQFAFPALRHDALMCIGRES